MDDLKAWHRELQSLLADVAETVRVLGIAQNSSGISDSVHSAAAERGETAVARIAAHVRRVNALAVRVNEPTLSIPGEAPEINLRPWWSRLLDKVSSTASRVSAVESLETLRLEADAALMRAASRLR